MRTMTSNPRVWADVTVHRRGPLRCRRTLTRANLRVTLRGQRRTPGSPFVDRASDGERDGYDEAPQGLTLLPVFLPIGEAVKHGVGDAV